MTAGPDPGDNTLTPIAQGKDKLYLSCSHQIEAIGGIVLLKDGGSLFKNRYLGETRHGQQPGGFQLLKEDRFFENGGNAFLLHGMRKPEIRITQGDEWRTGPGTCWSIMAILTVFSGQRQ